MPSIRDALSYDPVTGEFRWKIRVANRVHVGDIAGSLDAYGYRAFRIAGKNYKAHRVAWFLHCGSWPSRQIDHINEVRDDNRLVNLRLATKAENGRNRGKNKNNTSGFKGVSEDKKQGRWFAVIGVGGRRVFLGYYDTPEKAHVAYCSAATKYHGTFANTGTVQ